MELVLNLAPGGKVAPHDSKKYVELEFLNFTNPVQRKDAVHRKKVRKHVMKQSWQARKDHARHTKTYTRQLEVSKLEEKGMVTQAGEHGEADRFSALELEDLRRLGAGDRDPFSSFPIPTGQASGLMEMLLQHWIIELSPIMCPLEHAAKKTPNPVTQVLVPLAIKHASMFHALLAFSSSLMDARSGRTTGSATTLAHRVNTIRLINESIQDIQQATSDTILASICFLQASDCMFKDFKGQINHMDGIYRIVALRGGVDSVRTTMPLIYWRVIWADQMRSLLADTPPRYRLYSSPLRFPPIIQSLDQTKPWSVRCVLSDQFLYLIVHIRDLIQLMESCRGGIVSPAVTTHFDQQRGWIAYRLTELIAEKSKSLTAAPEQCCCLAAFLYHHKHFRPFLFLSGLQGILLAKLKQALLKTDLEVYWGDDIELLLWVLVTAAAVEDITKTWFVNLLGKVWNNFIPKPGLNRIKSILRRFLWNERTSGPDCDKVFKEMLGLELEGGSV
ncbi:hypothetical protein N431DRAFT_423933 [Stipitochalara longipes BDJ]|nr:hypothetical protein N431DRAFT_423933 [Stipitochalara longipes BDJ]